MIGGVENIIPDKLQRLQTTGQDAVNLLEESKDGGADRMNWDQVTGWCALGVNILMDHLDVHERIKVLAAAMNEAKKSG